MKIFTCDSCKNIAFFENSRCVRCGHQLAFLADRRVLSALEPSGNANDGTPLFLALDSAAEGRLYKMCKNYTVHSICNWAIPAEDTHEFCLACGLNEGIPDLSSPNALESWGKLEIAKRRLVYTLTELDLPLEGREQRGAGLAFAFKLDGPDGERVLTGHCDGLVTINMKEADTATREQTREKLGERYRTLLGHFRHESGHYYWDRLVRDSDLLPRFRELFGDEQLDYAEAVQRHYASPRLDWANGFISTYATMHPWEDWAETWAHYLHMVDTLETAQSYGVGLQPQAVGGAETDGLTQAARSNDFKDLVAAWFPLTLALNSLNRSMGLPDLYPFVLADRVLEKLAFVHEVVGRAAVGQLAQSSTPALDPAPTDGSAPVAPGNVDAPLPPAPNPASVEEAPLAPASAVSLA